MEQFAPRSLYAMVIQGGGGETFEGFGVVIRNSDKIPSILTPFIFFTNFTHDVEERDREKYSSGYKFRFKMRTVYSPGSCGIFPTEILTSNHFASVWFACCPFLVPLGISGG